MAAVLRCYFYHLHQKLTGWWVYDLQKWRVCVMIKLPGTKCHSSTLYVHLLHVHVE